MQWPSSCLQNTPNGAVAQLSCIPAVFANVVNIAVEFAGVVAVVFVILSGFKLITSGGDPKQVDAARKTLTYAIIGLTLIIISFAIIHFIAAATGASCITTFGFGTCQ